jgi:type VI secretion system secreted protein Hcp
MPDMYMQIDGLKGESTEREHKDWIEVLSFTHAISQPASATAAGSAAGRCQHSDYTITKRVDATSPKLYEMCSSGKHVQGVILEMMSGSGNKKARSMQVKMEHVMISHVAPSGGTDPASESVSFNYGKIKWTYTAQRADGSEGGNITGGWSLIENKVAA